MFFLIFCRSHNSSNRHKKQEDCEGLESMRATSAIRPMRATRTIRAMRAIISPRRAMRITGKFEKGLDRA